MSERAAKVPTNHAMPGAPEHFVALLLDEGRHTLLRCKLREKMELEMKKKTTMTMFNTYKRKGQRKTQ